MLYCNTTNEQLWAEDKIDYPPELKNFARAPLITNAMRSGQNTPAIDFQRTIWLLWRLREGTNYALNQYRKEFCKA